MTKEFLEKRHYKVDSRFVTDLYTLTYDNNDNSETDSVSSNTAVSDAHFFFLRRVFLNLEKNIQKQI